MSKRSETDSFLVMASDSTPDEGETPEDVDQRFAERLLNVVTSRTPPPLKAPSDIADVDLAFARNLLRQRVERSQDA
jgi:hypothetical protein